MAMQDIYEKISNAIPDKLPPYEQAYGESVSDCVVRNLEEWAAMLEKLEEDEENG